MKDYFNLRKSKLLLLSLFALMAGGVSPAWAEELTVYDGTSTNAEVPINGYYGDQYQKCEFIIPAGDLSAMNSATISSLKFYTNWDKELTSTFQVFLKEVASTTLSAYTGTTDATTVYEGTITATSNVITITFSNEYTYKGGNLLIGIYGTTKGSYASYGAVIKGQNVDQAAALAGKSSSSFSSVSGSIKYFIPKTTFIYETATPYKKPATLTTATIASYSAVINWTAGSSDNSETGWDLEYKASDSETWNEVHGLGASTLSYTLTNLSDNTSYDVRVRALYSGNVSEWKSATFQTLRAPITTFPWSEDFNSLTAGIPDGWDNSEGTTNTINYRWAYYGTGHDGECVRFNSYNNNTGLTNFLKTPVMSLPTGKSMQLKFWYKNPTGGDFSVYISNDGGVTYTTELATDLTGVSSWTEYEATIPSGFIDNVVIVFKGTSNYGNGDAYIYLDDVEISEAPACPKPTGLTASNATYNSVELAWTAGSDETAWKVIYDTTGFNPASEGTTIDVNTNPYTLTGLTPETTYDVYVKAVKGSDVSPVSNKASFTTTERYPAPTGLAISNVKATSATLTWVAGVATSWEVAINTTGTEPTEAGIEVNAAEYDFTGLTAETTYYAFVRTKDGSKYSNWSAACEFVPSAYTYLTLNEGTTTNSYVPIYGYFTAAANLGGQFIIPAANLTEVQNKVIKKLTFYSNTLEYDYGDAEFDICVKETSDATMPSSMYTWDNGTWTTVYNGKLAISGGKMTIIFTSDFNYTGSNLLIGIHKTSTDKSGANYNVLFYGNNSSNYMSNYNPNGNRQKFQPKTTIGYQEKLGSELKVFDGEKELTSSPASFDFGLAIAGATHTFTLKNTASTPYVATISSENLTVSPTEVTPTAEGVTFTVEMPDHAITNEAVVITPAVESGLEPFTINVSGTIRDASKYYTNFADGWDGWTASSNWTTNSDGYAKHSYKWGNNDLVSPALSFTEGETVMFKAQFNSADAGTTAPQLSVYVSEDGSTWGDAVLTVAEDELDGDSWTSKSFTISSTDIKYIKFNGRLIKITDVYGGQLRLDPIFAINTDGSEQDFGDIEPNAIAEKSFTITNSGKAELEVTATNDADFYVQKTINFSNSNGWSDVYVYAWIGDGEGAVKTMGEWPGQKQTNITGQNEYNQDIYAISIPVGTEKIIVNNGSGTQSQNITLDYTKSGLYLDGNAGVFFGEDANFNAAGNLVAAANNGTTTFTVRMKTNTVGNKTGNIILGFDDVEGDDRTFTIPVKGYVIDHSKLYVSFTGSTDWASYPEIMQHGDSWSIYNYQTTGFARQTSTTATSSLTLAPVTVVDGKSLKFKAAYNSNQSARELTVRYTTDGGLNWTDYDWSNYDWSTTQTLRDQIGYSLKEFKIVDIPAGTAVFEFEGKSIQLDDIIADYSLTTAPLMTFTTVSDNISGANLKADGTATYTLANNGNADYVGTVSAEGVTVEATGEGISFESNALTIPAGKTATITVTMAFGAPYGVKDGSLSITSESWVGDIAANYTATLVDPTAFVEDFAGNTKPAGWYNGGWTFAEGVAYVNSGTSKQMITELIGAEEGKNTMSFEAKMYYDYGTGDQTLNIYTSTDRKIWSEAQTFPLTAASQTFSLNSLTDGSYYVMFEAANATIDNITGVKKLALPEHDLMFVGVSGLKTNYTPGEAASATIQIANLLANNENDVHVWAHYRKNGEEVYSSSWATEQATIAAGNTASINLSAAAPAEEAIYDVMIIVSPSADENDAAAYTLYMDEAFTVAHVTSLAITNFTPVVNAVEADNNNMFTAEFNVTVKNEGSVAIDANDIDINITDNNNVAYDDVAKSIQTVFMVPGAYTADNAKFFIYRFSTDTDQEWGEFTKIADNLYSADLNGKTKFVIVRKASDATSGWEGAWNQSVDLEAANGICFTFDSWGGENNPDDFTAGNEVSLPNNASMKLKVAVTALAGNGGTFEFKAQEDVTDTWWSNSYGYTQSVNVTAAPTIVLSETDGTIASTGSNRKVRLSHTFVAGWNTICLPFEIEASEIAADAVAFSFDGYNTDTKELTFNKVTTSLEANKPYVIYVANAITEPIEFTGKNVNTSEELATTSNGITFQGTYAPMVSGTLTGCYGLTAEGKIAHAKSTTTMKGFRAYFTGDLAGARMMFVGDADTQGISTISMETEAPEGTYNLQGQKVQNIRKSGLYIINGKKQVVK